MRPHANPNDFDSLAAADSLFEETYHENEDPNIYFVCIPASDVLYDVGAAAAKS